MPSKTKEITFGEHRESTAKDCEQLARFIVEIAVKVRQGNMDAFVEFFIEGGTEEGDAKICQLRELLILRFACRRERVK